MASCPASGHHQESDFLFFTSLHQVFIDIDNTSPEPSLLQTNQCQLSAPTDTTDAPVP